MNSGKLIHVTAYARFFFPFCWFSTSLKEVNVFCIIFVVGQTGLAQLVKNLPAMQETPVQVLGWEDPLEYG